MFGSGLGVYFPQLPSTKFEQLHSWCEQLTRQICVQSRHPKAVVSVGDASTLPRSGMGLFKRHGRDCCCGFFGKGACLTWRVTYRKFKRDRAILGDMLFGQLPSMSQHRIDMAQIDFPLFESCQPVGELCGQKACIARTVAKRCVALIGGDCKLTHYRREMPGKHALFTLGVEPDIANLSRRCRPTSDTHQRAL
nr:hypothetical protein [Gulosibacter chungangensis]